MVRFNSAAETLHAKSVVVTDADVTSTGHMQHSAWAGCRCRRSGEREEASATNESHNLFSNQRGRAWITQEAAESRVPGVNYVGGRSASVICYPF